MGRFHKRVELDHDLHAVADGLADLLEGLERRLQLVLW